MSMNRIEKTLHHELAVLIGNGLRVDVDRLARDEPFAEVIPNFDSLSMLEILLLVEEKEGFSFDQHLGAGQGSSPGNTVDQLKFPVNVSALAKAVNEARRKESKHEKAQPTDAVRAPCDSDAMTFGTHHDADKAHGAAVKTEGSP